LSILRAVGDSADGLSVKQIARRCGIGPATAYHLVRTLIYEGYLLRRDDGSHMLGPEIADRYRDLVRAWDGPGKVGELLRAAARDTGYTHGLGCIVTDRIAATAVARGWRDWRSIDVGLPGFIDGPHATAMGKALLSTVGPRIRHAILQAHGMPRYTSATLTTVEALEMDLIAGARRGLFLAIGERLYGVASAAVVVPADGSIRTRLALSCTFPQNAVHRICPTLHQQLSSTASQLARTMRRVP